MSRRGFYRGQVAWRLCAWFGHRPTSRPGLRYFDRRGRERQRLEVYCARCGSGDAYEPGRLEWLAPRRFRWAVWPPLTCARRWIREDCSACRKPIIRFGRPVGDHAECDDIPF